MKRLVILSAFCFSALSADLSSAIRMVESSNRTGRIVGDGGAAIGPYQIHYSVWKDATEYDKSIKGTYQDCHKLDYSIRIFHAYLNRYARNQSDEHKARVWNGGPAGHKKSATIQYWNKVKKYLH